MEHGIAETQFDAFWGHHQSPKAMTPNLFYPWRDQPSCTGWTVIYQGSAERLGTSLESVMTTL